MMNPTGFTAKSELINKKLSQNGSTDCSQDLLQVIEL